MHKSVTINSLNVGGWPFRLKFDGLHRKRQVVLDWLYLKRRDILSDIQLTSELY